MDRDDHALSLVSGSKLKLEPILFDAAFSKLPDALKTEVLAKSALMRSILDEKRRGKKLLPTCKALADRLNGRRGTSAETLSDLFYLWAPEPHGRGHGAAALIDHRKCGSLSNEGACGVLGCTRSKQGALPKGVIELFRSHCGGNNKQGLTQSWEEIIRDLVAGEIIDDGLTWQTLHRQLFPGLPIPERCPWSLTNPPRGWSLSSFLRHKPLKPLLDTMKHGLSAAWNHTPEVREDLTKLRFLERVYFDDHKMDFEVMVWDRKGRPQIVELWGLFALDAATGACIEFGLRPKLMRPDGSTEGLTMRDMQHLISDILARYGYPTTYPMTLVVENAAAAVSKHHEELLRTRTGGQVVIQRTGTHSGDVLMQGFAERWGAPRGKAALESWFHILDIVLGMVKGQTGSNWTVKPGELEGRKKVARAMCAILTAHPELKDKLSSPLHWAGEAHLIVTEAIKEINARTDHDLQRHEIVTEWRWSENDPMPKPVRLSTDLPANIAADVREFMALPASTRERFLNYGGTRRESPAEKVTRIQPQGKFAALSPDTLFDLMMDSASAEYKGADVLDVEWKRGKQKIVSRYVGSDGSMRLIAHGTTVGVRFNSDKPEAGVWVHGPQGEFIAYMQHERDPVAHENADLEILQRRMGVKRKAHTELLHQARKLSSRRVSVQQREEQLDAEIKTLAMIVDAAPTVIAPTLPESATLARVVLGTKKPQAGPVRSAADIYLAMQTSDLTEDADDEL